METRMLLATAVLSLSTLNIVCVYFHLLPWERRGAATAPHLLEDEMASVGSGCAALQGEDREECMLERQQREKARERKAAKLHEDEVAIKAYKERRRAEKKLKLEQQLQEQQRQGRQQELEARAERDTQMRSRQQMQKQLEEERLVEANPELASLSELERKIWFLKQKVGDAAPPLPPGAGGEFAPWNNSRAWRRPCGAYGGHQLELTRRWSNASDAGDGSADGQPDAQEDEIDWFASRVDLASVSLIKREHGGGHLSKRGNVYKSLKYHHQPALVLLPSGDIVAIWQAAKDTEGEQDQHLQAAISSNGGRSWSVSFALQIVREGPLWSPVPHVDAAGRLWLFYTESDGDCMRSEKKRTRWSPGGTIKVVTTVNTTVSQSTIWTAPRTIHSIFDGGFIPKMLSNRMVVLSSGEWILPYWRDNLVWAATKWPAALSHCRTKMNAAGQPWSNTAEVAAGILVSQDGGSSWSVRGSVTTAVVPGAEDSWGVGVRTTWLVENSVEELRDGKLLMLFRTHDTGFIYSATSSNKGYDWTEPTPTDVPNPDSKTQIMRIKPDGPLVMAFNDHRRDALTVHGKEVKLPDKCRTQLSLAWSSDDGASWRRAGVIKGGSALGLRYHSPALIQVGCKLLMAYSKMYVSGYRQKDEVTHFSLKVTELTLQHGVLKMCMPRWGRQEAWMYMCRNARKHVVEDDEVVEEEEEGEAATETEEEAAEPDEGVAMRGQEDLVEKAPWR